MKVIDAENTVLGRLATNLAKDLLNGEKVIVINAEKAIISGNKKDIFARYKQRFDRADRANPRKGPMFPRTPDKIVKRAVRGMVNYTTKRGKKAYGNLKTYIGVPEGLEGEPQKYEVRTPNGKTITVRELSEYLGWRNKLE